MAKKTETPHPTIPLNQFKALIVCRGPIAMEALEVAAEIGMPPPDIVVSKREVFESVEARAPWSQHRELYENLHIVDDYRDQDAIVDYARRHAIDAVYVGYGYSAENSEFIGRLEQAGIIPVAPPSKVMAFSGSKFRAKRHVREKLGIPVLPGSDRAAELSLAKGVKDAQLIAAVKEEVRAILDEAPDQVIRLKAAKGGGGKGQRLIRDAGDAEAAVREIWAEIGARGVDGDKGILVELNLIHPRHWEIQILSDGETVVHFGGRECSIQNVGSQKFIEVSLHPGQYDPYIASLDPKKNAGLIRQLRDEQKRIRTTCDYAVRIMRSLGYRGAGTVEFLVAESGGPEILGKPHFMEINSRIQVEHRVSEAVAKVRGERRRLVGEQFRIAAGEKLGYAQKDIAFSGYAIEARINASNSNFLIGASGSVIQHYRLPPRDENFYYDDGGAASLFMTGRRRRWAIPNFDSNFGLAVFRGETQREAFERARDLLESFDIAGNEQLRTTVPFHLGVISLLLGSEPYGKIRTDFSEIFLAFGATIYNALAKIEEKTIAPGDPLARLLSTAVERFRAEPALAAAFAFRERELRGRARGKKPVREVMRELARLERYPLFPEEERALDADGDDYPEAVKRILKAVEDSRIFEFRRRAQDLDFNIPPNVAEPRTRRLTIEELKDKTILAVKPRTLVSHELRELQEILKGLESKLREEIDDEKIVAQLRNELAACLEHVRNNHEIDAERFHHFYDDLRSFKWVIHKANFYIELERALISEVNRAFRIVSGPNVVTPLAGTIYLRPSPDKPFYVREGDEVVADETVVALIENMKMFNEIRAHMTGRVKAVMVENERPVLPGDVIMVIE